MVKKPEKKKASQLDTLDRVMYFDSEHIVSYVRETGGTSCDVHLVESKTGQVVDIAVQLDTKFQMLYNPNEKEKSND